MPPSARTVGELRRSGHVPKPLRTEIRDNLLDALREGRDPWPGLHGFGSTVIPQLERALIAGHDIVLLGERGQGKTRLLRTLAGLLDEWSPVIEGSEGFGEAQIIDVIATDHAPHHYDAKEREFDDAPNGGVGSFDRG